MRSDTVKIVCACLTCDNNVVKNHKVLFTIITSVKCNEIRDRTAKNDLKLYTFVDSGLSTIISFYRLVASLVNKRVR